MDVWKSFGSLIYTEARCLGEGATPLEPSLPLFEGEHSLSFDSELIRCLVSQRLFEHILKQRECDCNVVAGRKRDCNNSNIPLMQYAMEST